jgi:MinD-like ATPase involved in chromosome partitioning or flagellar assembly
VAPGFTAPGAPARPDAAPRPPAPVRLVPARRSVAGPPPARSGPVRSAPGVERVLSGPGEQRSVSWRNHVTVVPGGRGPGRPDHEKEARARAVLPLNRPRLVLVLGCTVGAGQTVTTLMLADLLARLRDEPVAALDLNPGPASLTELARVPATTVSALLARPPGAHAAHAAGAGHTGQAASVMHRGASRGRGRLDVICQDAAPEDQADGKGASASLQHSRMLDLLASRYLLTLADPGASAVAKVLPAADQLVLVAPASADAAQAVSMTCEWLGAHGQSALAAHSIAMINGVSRRSVRHAEQAELVLRGRCRAMVRVPWDDHLAEPEPERGIRASVQAPGAPSRLDRLHPAVLQAYTALAGVLVSALTADPARRRAAR